MKAWVAKRIEVGPGASYQLAHLPSIVVLLQMTMWVVVEVGLMIGH
jgi:hypothetical protein